MARNLYKKHSVFKQKQIVSTDLTDIHEIRIGPNELNIPVVNSKNGTITASNNLGDIGNRFLYEQEMAHLKDCLCKKDGSS